MLITKYETNFKKNLFFNQTYRRDEKLPERFENELINIYPDITYQEFLGFGGAITESSGYCYNKLPEETKPIFIDAYFSKNGLNYSLARLPIGSSDFSLEPYSYSYKKDLSDFSIEKDKEYILPLLKAAGEKTNLTCVASPWSPPKFMKNTKMLTFGGKLRTKYKQTMADYFVKYINAYKNEGFPISFVTVQNEPNAIQPWESCLYNSYEEAEFVVNYLLPTFEKNDISTKILVWDHNKERLFTRAKEIFSVPGAIDRIAGLAYHYYSKDHFENIKLVRELYPDKLLIHTEGCTGFSDINDSEEFKNGEIYAHDIIGDLNAGSNGYIDWNILLDSKGGPNHKKNYCKSPIMLNQDETDFIKTSSYYYIGHFSKYIRPYSKRIAFSNYSENLEITAFKNTDNSIVVVILNRKWFDINFNICIHDRVIKDQIESNSILTYIISV